jgi:hypothetical protein
MSVSLGGTPDAYISPPLESAGSSTLAHGEQLVFARDFDGRLEDRSYIECAQRLTHSFDLHYVPERSAYCRFDEHGDIEDVIRIQGFEDTDTSTSRAVTIAKDVLEEYMTLTGQSLVLMFDSIRHVGSPVASGNPKYDQLSDDIFYRTGHSLGSASYIRGVAVVRSHMTLADVVARHGFGPSNQRQYASFIAHDWKHDKIQECSCNPAELGNYFVKSNFPYETSPAFFNARVLQKYKADTDKYRVQDRSILCRHAWYLQNYDINEAGQVHTYLIYLSHLPYDEQLYWKSFNEEPKAPISKRSYKTDFLGKFDLDYDPLGALKNRLCELDDKHVPWWTPRDRGLFERVHYPVTDAADEWSRDLHNFEKLLVEGFEVKAIRKIAKNHQVTIDKQWGSLKLLDELLRALGCDDEARELIMTPLQELRHLRSKLSGHASGLEAKKLKARILKNYRTYRMHFRDLCERCDKAVADLTEILESATSTSD